MPVGQSVFVAIRAGERGSGRTRNVRMSLQPPAAAAGARATHASLPLLRVRAHDAPAIGTPFDILGEDERFLIIEQLSAVPPPLHVDVVYTHIPPQDNDRSLHIVTWLMKIKHESAWRTRLSKEQIQANFESVRKDWIQQMKETTDDEYFSGPRFRYTPDRADGLEWKLLGPTALPGWSEVRSANIGKIQQALRSTTTFEPSVVSSWSIEDLRSNNYVCVDGSYYGPADGFDAVNWSCQHDGHNVALSLPKMVTYYGLPGLVQQIVKALCQDNLQANKIYFLKPVEASLPVDGDTVHFTLKPTSQHPAVIKRTNYKRILLAWKTKSGGGTAH